MNYEETLQYLYRQLPVFQQVGQSAYKPGLGNSLALDRLVGYPHRRYATIHIAGTNGKGSTSHVLAAAAKERLQSGSLHFTPSHRLPRTHTGQRRNDYPGSRTRICRQVSSRTESEIHPSFFELTMMMAFDYFASRHVDVAVIETGLGGRLDSTNIITPRACVITNISYDHMAQLGHTLTYRPRKGRYHKGGIPVVIGEAEGDVRRVFEEKAREESAPIYFAQESDVIHLVDQTKTDNGLSIAGTTDTSPMNWAACAKKKMRQPYSAPCAYCDNRGLP